MYSWQRLYFFLNRKMIISPRGKLPPSRLSPFLLAAALEERMLGECPAVHYKYLQDPGIPILLLFCRQRYRFLNFGKINQFGLYFQFFDRFSPQRELFLENEMQTPSPLPQKIANPENLF